MPGSLFGSSSGPSASRGSAHPAGAAAVKELYSGGVLLGWAVGVKTNPDSADGDNWFWYETRPWLCGVELTCCGRTAAGPAKPASTWKIGGVSVSTVDAAGLKAPVEKAGYTIVGEPVKVMIRGDRETVQSTAKEAFEKLKKASEKSKSLSGSLDEVAEVLVVIELLKDETGAAKKLYDALVAK